RRGRGRSTSRRSTFCTRRSMPSRLVRWPTALSRGHQANPSHGSRGRSVGRTA
ncbi:MAG: hypothetical protein AVDCRST_MAG70-1167, partial [uncultured Thermomicrobiales bacterium]